MALSTTRARHRGRSGHLSFEDRKSLSVHAIKSEARSRLDAILAVARTMTPVADPGEHWDTMPGLIGAPNGVIDLRLGKPRDGRPEDRITMQVGVPFEPEVESPRWERFLFEVLGDRTVVTFVQRLAGYSLTGEASLDFLIFLMGGWLKRQDNVDPSVCRRGRLRARPRAGAILRLRTQELGFAPSCKHRNGRYGQA
jgi:hypothetical protein